MPERDLSEATTFYGPLNRGERSRTIADTFDPISIGNRTVKLADRAGHLEASSVWAFFCLILIFYTVWKERWYRKDREDSQKIRSDEAATMLLTANALQKLSDASEKLEIVIDERLPRRSNGYP